VPGSVGIPRTSPNGGGVTIELCVSHETLRETAPCRDPRHMGTARALSSFKERPLFRGTDLRSDYAPRLRSSNFYIKSAGTEITIVEARASENEPTSRTVVPLIVRLIVRAIYSDHTRFIGLHSSYSYRVMRGRLSQREAVPCAESRVR
jgi:hypothetical protein